MPEYVLLVGAGPMAVEYAKVLGSMNTPFKAVGRGSSSAAAFKESTGHEAYVGGIERWLEENSAGSVSSAIIAVGEARLGSTTRELLQSGIRKILCEKPGAASPAELRDVAAFAASAKGEVFLGYNRRFYASVKRAKEMIAEDGGATSFSFEFTEWAHVIEKLYKEEGVKENWFFHNSTHVVDLAFFLGGRPAELTSYKSGSLPWHPDGKAFVGAGRTAEDVLFSYQANWAAPGRWGVEILTEKRRLVLRPMEQLQVWSLGTVRVEAAEIDDDLDKRFKPGLYREVESFLGDKRDLCSLDEQQESLGSYEAILRGGEWCAARSSANQKL